MKKEKILGSLYAGLLCVTFRDLLKKIVTFKTDEKFNECKKYNEIIELKENFLKQPKWKEITEEENAKMQAYSKMLDSMLVEYVVYIDSLDRTDSIIKTIKRTRREKLYLKEIEHQLKEYNVYMNGLLLKYCKLDNVEEVVD